MPEEFVSRSFQPRNLQPQRTVRSKDSEQIIEGLSEENRKLSEAIANLEQEVKILRQRSTSASTTEKELNSLKLELSDLQKNFSTLKRQNSQLEATNKRLQSQTGETSLKALTPEEGTGLINRTIESIANVKNFKLVDANVKLKLATAKVGEEGTLVFPNPDTKVDPAVLQEIEFKIVRDSNIRF
ncbi:hypothetical protein Lepto7376_4582 [[Leptolyngbya] sp. PCC 7376]|uniref:hypothetical protein n=1 Tax=[Leptolyngbya] sp. PCC 7376 TaxID=111781 RepID=UPI00029F4E21|nr:hypothetical protein [[Leptolyngbya] sp. PCC 7376]AFY40673.1 hypothetical protein Lepto7376_4582 [[Leptolyngbya] sp. PCC 7376]